jgi:hypothetical protein
MAPELLLGYWVTYYKLVRCWRTDCIDHLMMAGGTG